MTTFFIHHRDLVWPLVLLFSWVIGEFGSTLTKIPPIVFYILFGFIFAKHQLGLFPAFDNLGIIFLVNIAAGLILFKFGYRINLHWLKKNPLILLTSILESSLTFITVLIITKIFGLPTILCLEIASLSMATSPFVIMYIVSYQQSSGQVTERALHLTALNCIFAIFAFKIVSGLLVLQISGNLWHAIWASILMVILSSVLGIIFAFLLAGFMKYLLKISDCTVGFALFIIVLVAFTKSVTLSPIIAVLSFALTVRYRYVAIGNQKCNFGALGDLLVVILFFVTPLNLSWHDIRYGIELTCSIFLGRLIAKTAIVSILSHFSGVSWSKSLLSGLALTPISIFSFILLDQSQVVELVSHQRLAVISSLIIFELIGPIITNLSLIKAKEVA